MSEPRGMLDLEALTRGVRDGDIDTVLVVFSDLYGRWMGKRYDADFFLESAVPDGAHVCDYLLTADIAMEPMPGYQFANWESGYGDVHLIPDMATLRIASWLEKTALVICDVSARDGDELLSIAPRSILRAQIDRARALGFEARCASELEFFIFDHSYEEAARRQYVNLAPAGTYIEDYHILQGTRHEALVGGARRHLRDSGVPVENSKGEWGIGQHELNVRYTDALAMADRHAVFKQCLKEFAESLGKSVTFMAKPYSDRAGSSCHIHMSLWRDETNAFPGPENSDGVSCSDEFRWFLGGWMAHASASMPFYAPNVNSYKRYRAATWAPTKIAWARDNRTASFRVVGDGPSLRIECRIPGADCNPYLAFAAALASGLDGIENRISPPALFDGDVYAANELDEVPTSLENATDQFEASPFARRAFGDDVVEHYTHFFRVEDQAARCAVTDWERRRYFEQI